MHPFKKFALFSYSSYSMISCYKIPFLLDKTRFNLSANLALDSVSVRQEQRHRLLPVPVKHEVIAYVIIDETVDVPEALLVPLLVPQGHQPVPPLPDVQVPHSSVLDQGQRRHVLLRRSHQEGAVLAALEKPLRFCPVHVLVELLSGDRWFLVCQRKSACIILKEGDAFL